MKKTREIVEITTTPADGDGAIIIARCADGTLWQGYTIAGGATADWRQMSGIPIDDPNLPQISPD